MHGMHEDLTLLGILLSFDLNTSLLLQHIQQIGAFHSLSLSHLFPLNVTDMAIPN